MLTRKMVTPKELENMLSKQKEDPKKRLASIAVEQGILNTRQVLEALSDQHGVLGIDLEQLVIPQHVLKLIPKDVASHTKILPIAAENDTLFLAMADPSDHKTKAEIEYASGHRVIVYVAIHEQLMEVLERAYQVTRGFFIGREVSQDYLKAHNIHLDLVTGEGMTFPDEQPLTHGESLLRTHSIDSQSFPPGNVESSDTFEPSISPVSHQDITVKSQVNPLLQKVSLFMDAPAELIWNEWGDPFTPKDFHIESCDTEALILKLQDETSLLLQSCDANVFIREPYDVPLLDYCFLLASRFDPRKTIVALDQASHSMKRDLEQKFGFACVLSKPMKPISVFIQIAALLGRSNPAKFLSHESEQSLLGSQQALQSGDVDMALEYLISALQQAPYSVALRKALADLYMHMGQFHWAIRELEITLELDPHAKDLYVQMSKAYGEVGFSASSKEMAVLADFF